MEHTDNLQHVVVHYSFKNQGKNRIGTTFPEIDIFSDYLLAFNFIANHPDKKKMKFIEISTLLCVSKSGVLHDETFIFFRFNIDDENENLNVHLKTLLP
eukprot:gene3338-5886_t